MSMMDNINGELVSALYSATSQDPAKVKAAEEWLKHREKCDGFYVMLSEICRMQEIDWPARWMAAIYLKNGIERCWRSCLSFSINKEGRDLIKKNMLLCLEEPVNQIAMQLYVGIAKIARMDYPEHWDSLIPTLFSGLSSPKNSLHQARCLSTLKHVIKTLSLKKLPFAKELFMNFCNNAVSTLFQYWTTSHDSLIKIVQSENGQNAIPESALENYVTTTKIVYYIIQDYNEEVLKKIYEVTFKHLLETRKMSELFSGSKADHCKKVCIICMKILESLLGVGHTSYTIGAQRTMSLVSEHIFSRVGHNNDEIDEKYILKCVITCKSVIDGDLFEKVFLGDDKDLSVIGPSIETLFQCLVCHYLPLKEEDLLSWEDDPEEFCNEEFGESWKFNLRPCVEVLSETLLKHFRELLVPALLKMLDVVQDLNSNSLEDILSVANPVLQVILKGCTSVLECMVRKEAVYYMIGLAAYDIVEVFDFKHWFMDKLLLEVKSVQNESHGKLIHRRVLWLISQWFGAAPPSDVRPTIYMFVVESMRDNFDMAVRLAALSATQTLLDDFEFDIAIFQEYQDLSFQRMYKLLLEVKNCDTKMRILNVITFLIERLGKGVEPYSQTISDIVPHLWAHASNENHDMLKCAIMSMINQFIYGMGEKSTSISHLIIPLIATSTDLNNPSHVYLLEDGLELWLSAVYNCGDPNETFFNLFNNIFPVLEYGSETLRTCFSIIEGYVLLYGDTLLDSYGQKLDESFASISSDVKNECLTLISGLVSTILEACKNTGVYCATYCKVAFSKALVETDSVLLSANFTLAANVIMKSIANFVEIIDQMCQDASADFKSALNDFIVLWCNSIDTIIETDRRKLCALALLTLLSNINHIPSISIVFHNIICAVVQILYDVCDEKGEDALVDSSDGLYKDTDGDLESLHDMRRRKLRKSSFAATISLPSFAAMKIKSMQDVLPHENFSKLMSTLDANEVKELNSFITTAK